MRPDYYTRIAQKYRQLDLEDPVICAQAVRQATDEFNACSARDPVYAFYRTQQELLNNYELRVAAYAVPVKADVPSIDPIVPTAVGVITLVVIPAIYMIWSSIGSSMALAVQ